MLDNPDKSGIYPTTRCFEQFDTLYDTVATDAIRSTQDYYSDALAQSRVVVLPPNELHEGFKNEKEQGMGCRFY